MNHMVEWLKVVEERRRLLIHWHRVNHLKGGTWWLSVSRATIRAGPQQSDSQTNREIGSAPVRCAGLPLFAYQQGWSKPFKRKVSAPFAALGYNGMKPTVSGTTPQSQAWPKLVMKWPLWLIECHCEDKFLQGGYFFPPRVPSADYIFQLFPKVRSVVNKSIRGFHVLLYEVSYTH